MAVWNDINHHPAHGGSHEYQAVSLLSNSAFKQCKSVFQRFVVFEIRDGLKTVKLVVIKVCATFGFLASCPKLIESLIYLN